jgi:hypothetical protein
MNATDPEFPKEVDRLFKETVHRKGQKEGIMTGMKSSPANAEWLGPRAWPGWGNCPDCNAPIGAEHVTWDDPQFGNGECDVARCLETGRQRLSCEESHDHGRDVWTGEWPGERECFEMGLLTESGDPDLNRLLSEGRWDKVTRRWVLIR